MIGTLPEGSSKIRVLRGVVSRRPGLLVPASLRRVTGPILAGAAAVAIAAILDHAVLHVGFNAFLLGPIALIAGTVAVVLSASQPDQHLHHLTAEDHAELYDLVHDVADALAVRRPRRISVWAHPDSVAVRPLPWRSELWLGLPYLTEMSSDELRAVIAYELTLLKLRRSCLVNAALSFLHEEVPRGGGLPVEVEMLAMAAIKEADAAAVRIAGERVTTAALWRGGLISYSFTWFAVRYAWPMAGLRWYPSDLYVGWRWKVHHDDLHGRFIRHLLEDERPFGMKARVTVIGGEQGEVLPVVVGVLPTGLPKEIEARLARAYLREEFPAQYVKSVAFATLPDTIWDAVFEQQLADVSEALARVLNKATVTPRDVLDIVVTGRVGEITWDHRDWLCTHSTPEVCVLFPLLHHALRSGGYRYEHPLRQRLLVSDDGRRVDVVALAEQVAGGGPVPDWLPLGGESPDLSRRS
ncbi:hypothetical protein [Microtetraspora sp. NBRC 16547]|uniref:hypothetical protein n=1 Tax=Microtetraspora sp. NBRC 16547 TaxID=3030993 RepID=UPI0024A078E6|nr:hypothetical protein [Microtetraspora sp. NBRC 16547]GLW98876.1 hypothetical protein Misp02_29630 [Microtetraspora sp. NBRC 16547]